jgi:hypothetical protein
VSATALLAEAILGAVVLGTLDDAAGGWRQSLARSARWVRDRVARSVRRRG